MEPRPDTKRVMRPRRPPRPPRPPRPVSCHYCRSKKLRCSRQFPCDNCAVKGLTCQLYDPARGPPLGEETQQEIPSALIRFSSGNSSRMRWSAKEGLSATNNVQLASWTKENTTPAPNLQSDTAADDVKLLESGMMDQSSAALFCPDKIVCRTCPVRQITRTTSYTYLDPPTPSYTVEPVKCVWLPRREEAKVFVDKYLRDITYIHHVVHAPSLRKLADGIYHELDQRQPIQPGRVALLLSIVASATFIWTTQDDHNLYRSVDDARNQSASWVIATLDMLDHSRRTTNGSIEDVQALILVSFLVCNMEGTSLRYFELVSRAITTARQLYLHRIDHPSRRPQIDSIQAEVGRRVWWYLAALDWILSRFPGPHEGICTVQPRQMMVNKPRNIPDEHVVEGLPLVGLHITQPTSMSYFLQRVRLGELCYQASNQSSTDNWEIATSDEIMEVDAQFEKFISDFPPFFNLEDDGDSTSADRASKDPAIIVQAYILTGMVQARRCKLHLPSLSRSPAEPRLARSRQICLDAARTIIAAERRLEKETAIPFALSRFRFGGTLYCLFLAIVTLLLDVCLNKAAAVDHEDRRRSELAQAFQILEEAQSQTAIATTLLESLQRLVHKYKVSLPAVGQDVSINRPVMPPADMPYGLGTGRSNTVPDPDVSNPEFPFFDEVWQTFEGGMQLDELDLESIFADINSFM
ncbi:uncharacterized protein PV07_05106 [Cladophialophora immunda]|uniref:Zn(2)-C6 fungal-type domain-containing protein n=1 Tax=Cladophialophora immunda TaxID=569365 RepID=A0A0D1ZMU3_9EURO|nr:uncharacterized protein PV07_05106 [Cladophialophora immunda]KIW29281.1 hypothetical protein PV07_05106 [Cladophialophora immunda]